MEPLCTYIFQSVNIEVSKLHLFYAFFCFFPFFGQEENTAYYDDKEATFMFLMKCLLYTA